MFSKHHYEYLANWARFNLNYQQINSLANNLAVDNTRFNKDKFIKAATRPLPVDEQTSKVDNGINDDWGDSAKKATVRTKPTLDAVIKEFK